VSCALIVEGAQNEGRTDTNARLNLRISENPE
jgi:hypothetical protein